MTRTRSDSRFTRSDRRPSARERIFAGPPRSRIRPSVSRVRDAFRVEALEPRVLLSANPVLSTLRPEGSIDDWLAEELLREAGASQWATDGQVLPMASADALLCSLASQGYDPIAFDARRASGAFVAALPGHRGDVDVFQAGMQGGGAAQAFEPAGAFGAWGVEGVFEAQAFGEGASGDHAGGLPVWDLQVRDGLAVEPEVLPLTWADLGLPAVDDQPFDLASLSAATGTGALDLRIAQGQTLAGSGAFGGALTVDGMLSPGYSPGVMSYGQLTLQSTSVTEFEIGGPTAGTGTDFHDQINVSGQALLDGQLVVRLIDGFRPTDGQVFNVLNYGSVGGAFASGSGLVDAGNGVFFEIVADAQGLDLRAHVLDPTVTALVGALTSAVGANDAALHDRVGTWLNFDYFRDNTSFSFYGAIALG